MFNNPSIQSNITQLNGTSIVTLVGFEMYSSNKTTYNYVMDWTAGKVFILNDQWEFISAKVFIRPTFMISINNAVFIWLVIIMFGK